MRSIGVLRGLGGALSQPEPPVLMYPLRHYRPPKWPPNCPEFSQMQLWRCFWRAGTPPRRSHNLSPPPQCTPFGISGPQMPRKSIKFNCCAAFGGAGRLPGAITTSPHLPNVPSLAFASKTSRRIISNSIEALLWRAGTPPRRSHNLSPPSQCTPLGISSTQLSPKSLKFN